MAISQLPLGYCANVHAGQTFDAMLGALERFAVPLARRLDRPLAVGLWLPAAVIREMALAADRADQLFEFLSAHRLECHTMNAFPYGDFHAERVKEQVYLPDWSQTPRVLYTRQCAEILERLLPAGGVGSISTVPLAFKRLHPADQGYERYFDSLLEVARQFAELRLRTGKHIRLAIEPEPLCLLETTSETIAFFHQLWDHAMQQRTLAEAMEHLGVCYDVCHQAVEYEAVAESIAALDQAGVRIVKVHVTNALELSNPRDPDARAELAKFVEPRYLHQTLARQPSGDRLALEDLTAAHAQQPPADWLESPSWRIHFHVPVDWESFGRLRTTRSALREALAAVAQLDYAPHLEVETYTWNVLSKDAGAEFDLVAGLDAELRATANLLDEVRPLQPTAALRD